jgi:hypothetical protein
MYTYTSEQIPDDPRDFLMLFEATFEQSDTGMILNSSSDLAEECM